MAEPAVSQDGDMEGVSRSEDQAQQGLRVTPEPEAVDGADPVSAGVEPEENSHDVTPPLITLNAGEGSRTKGRGARLSQKNGGAPILPPTTATPATPSVAGWKSSVPGNEAVRSMANQAKITREEHRGKLDGRHKYLFSKLADVLGQDEPAVEDAILADERFEQIQDFFAANGSKRLMFFCQETTQPRDTLHSRGEMFNSHVGSTTSHKRLFITTGADEAFAGTCYFFLRTTEKAISTANIAQEINFGVLECPGGDILQGVEGFLSSLMIPALKSQETWGIMKGGENDPAVEMFLDSVNRFMQSLSGVRQNIQQKVQLTEVDLGAILDGVKGPADYTVAVGNTEMVERLEAALSVWIKQIEQVLVESEQIRREADNVGPSAELVYWRKRTARFNSLLEELKSERVQKVLGLLQAARSRSLKHWKELDSRITEEASEAKDNVKYLYSLEKFFGPLAKYSPPLLMQTIPSLMNNIRMVHTVSRYYNSSEHMTSLFVKVTNQMIATCKAYLHQGGGKIWDHDWDKLLQRISECVRLNEEYQRCFHETKKYLHQSSNPRQFEFSENYIFGKFDSFCTRLRKLSDMLQTMQNLAGLQHVRIEGIDKIFLRYQAIATNTKAKTYDVLDHRKSEFDIDYKDFCSQTEGLYQSLQTFVDTWFEKSLTTEKMLELLEKFERIAGGRLQLMEKYQLVLHRYARDMDMVKRTYEKQKQSPPIPRNIPPVSGKIMWARQLFRKIDIPMKFMNNKRDVLQTPEGKIAVRNYNNMAAVLLKFELLYHRLWSRAVDQARNSLLLSVLVRDPKTKEFFVNFDLAVFELLMDAKHLHKLGFQVPDVIVSLCLKEQQIKQHHTMLQEALKEYMQAVSSIPPILQPLMAPCISLVEDTIVPGLSVITWTSLNIDSFIQEIQTAVAQLKQTTKQVVDILECRVEATLYDMSFTPLVTLPEEEALDMLAFIAATETTVASATKSLATQSHLVEKSVLDLLEVLKQKLKPAERADIKDGFPCLHSDSKHKTRCQECLPCAYYNFMGQICQRNTEALVRCTRRSLDALRRRLQTAGHYAEQQRLQQGHTLQHRSPLFRTEIVLAIPNVLLKPSLDELQSSLNKAVNAVLGMAKNISLWTYAHLQQKQQQLEMQVARDLGDESIVIKQRNPRTLNKQITEHKDVVKVMFHLSSVLSFLRVESTEVLKNFSCFSSLWSQEPEEMVKQFMTTDPTMSEFNAQMMYYAQLEQQVQDLPAHFSVGPVLALTESLKLALVQECRTWKRGFGAALNRKASASTDEVLAFSEAMAKRLARPVGDLEDVRSAMAALAELRAAEIKMESAIGPVEEAFAMLAKYDLTFRDSSADRVDGLAYCWNNLMTQSVQVQNTLVVLQPTMKADLLTGVAEFTKDLASFHLDYDTRGPGEPGIAPQEASDRLQMFQMQFDDLWRKFTTYSGGEELFGLPVTDYPELQRIRRELALLQKLYGLYNTVIESVDGYYEILWNDLDIEKINNELLDFQNKCRKLPKALKEWQAFEDLKKKIDNFNETCPLLEMMANKAMMSRHWERIANVTGHTFDIESDHFALKNIMEAPLLTFKDDIEDICISATKERDIDAKLKAVVSEWSSQCFTFAPFKSRGELLLKGSDTAEKVALMEDSLMVLASLMSNRYNVPFKPTIQQWVQKLSNTTEIIENWMMVQNLWIYLEAVFVGGDIAKQLPQEAKRFQNIDKSWQKIMQRAHEIPGIVACCVGDETLAQLLPHLLEQLEMCQKSLTGYLEKKRLVFPRFFFVSDPALLEILGQASDPHTIQAHLLGLFDNVNRVGFHEKNYEQILSIESQEGESVTLVEPVMAQGNVETWLGSLLTGVRSTVHSVIRQAAAVIEDGAFKLHEFQASFPAQVGLLAIQMIWTRDSEQALNNAKNDRKIMPATNQKFLDLLNELIDMTTSDLTKRERVKYETLITIHVHQKDIFDDLVRMNIKSTADFEWLKQSRFYFVEDTDKCLIQITDVDFHYCNEYLGCTDRLVITPLTDRCYITLAQALGMSMGGAPAGPAGTGKTETTKDMGKCLGKYVVVFNCSDQMDYRGLGRIYKGLAQSGAWGCFDEFNRIELPVLSVAAQQIYIVLQCKKNKRTQFVFTDGDIVEMDREFGIFLTMNPGYAGRQELPENLKIQFRTVAMMVPDRAIIMRVKLASAGFRDNQILSRKFYTLYKLCEEQLSKQVHYDFGLRNILSVLRTLGAVKRSNPEEPEKTVVMRVLRDMNLSKLVDEDEPLFMSLINDLFPGITLDKAGYPELEEAIMVQTKAAGLVHHPPWVLKIIQLYETQRVRHGMMALGPSGAGKTCCIHVLMKAMSDCGEPHREMRMNPKAITAPQMFGTLDVATNDWTDGIFSTLWRKTLKAKKGEHIWIVLDGPVDAIWIENLNSVLDDNKTLTLANGDRIPMAPNCKVVFEPHNIDNASPATVSRNGMVFMSSSVLDWRPIVQAWLQGLPAEQAEVLWATMDSVFQDLINFVFTAVNPKMDILECMYIKQAIQLLQGLLPEADERRLERSHLQRLLVFALMWSVGALLELEDRARMEVFLRAHSSRLDLPGSGHDDSMFEYVVGDSGAWEHWNMRVSNAPTASLPSPPL